MLDRRSLLARLAGHGAATGIAAALPWRLALAAPARQFGDKRLIVVILRGGLDGLAAVPPLADSDHAALRGPLALEPPGSGEGSALDLDGRFGLHPALAPFQRWYADGQMLVVHAVTTPYRARSHFDGQDLLENGTAAPRGAGDGWLNRALSVFDLGRPRVGLALGQAVPLMLRGATPVATWAPSIMPEPDADLMAKLTVLYQRDPLLGPALAQGIAAAGMSAALMGEDGDMAAPRRGRAGGRPAAAFRGPAALKLAALAAGKLLGAADGPRVAVLETGGWDTHVNQGAATGRLAQALTQLADAMGELRTGLAESWRHAAILVMTEFGRTAAVNGTGGTDHGTASVAFLLGGAVAGGRVLGRWPGLSPADLFEGRDVAPTADLRAVAKGVLADHLGLPGDALDRVVFPNSRGVERWRGLIA